MWNSSRKLSWSLTILEIYINDKINSSDKVLFRIFADDTNIFASSQSVETLETLMNSELAKIYLWYDIN